MEFAHLPSHTPYILRRGTALVYRRRVPMPLRQLYQKSFFSFSLRTYFVAEGRRRAAVATRFVDDLVNFVEACGPKMFGEDQYDNVIDAMIRIEIEAAEGLREIAGPRTPDTVTASIRLHEATRETVRAALVYNNLEAVKNPLERALAALGVSTEMIDTTDWQRLGRRAARALLEVADENIRRDRGVYSADVRLPAALRAEAALNPSSVSGCPGALPAYGSGNEISEVGSQRTNRNDLDVPELHISRQTPQPPASGYFKRKEDRQGCT